MQKGESNNLVQIGVIGYGYWGPNLVRNFSKIPGCRVNAVADLNPHRLAAIKQTYPTVRIFESTEQLVRDSEVDAVCIATPVSTHFPLAKRALEEGKHVLLEKPMTSSCAEAETLINLSAMKGKVLMVDHTYLYNPAVIKIKDLIDGGSLGKIAYFDSTRINLGLIQQDINVIWDLAVHDISIMLYLLGQFPESVNTTGTSHVHNNIANIAYMTLNYNSGLIAHFNCSWSSPVKIRHILIGGSKKMVVFNDLESNEKVKVYDSGHSIRSEEDKYRILYDYRVGDVYSPRIEHREALSLMASDFLDAVVHQVLPRSNSKMGLDVVRILEASDLSIKKNGSAVPLQ